MCGICGVASLEDASMVDEQILRNMCRSLVHRGPDDEGFYVVDGVGLAVRRLSIIDLQGGHQPIHNEDQSIWIVFNGEVYNYRELRRTLQALGHRFKTNSDTEVIVHSYEEFGDECVQYLNGMFAFAIWDGRKGQVFAARDRLGIKPFYYSLIKGKLVFGSELKALLAHPDIERRIDLISLCQYLSFEYVPTPRSILKNVFRLPPGHTLRYSKHGLSVESYWDVSFVRSESRQPINWTEYKQRLREKLKESVQKEMVSDVPLGVLLSGGIDSSTVAAMMVDLSPGNISSFSIGFSDPSFDESRYARLVADHLGTNHHELTVTPKMLLDVVPRLAYIMDEPIGDSSIVPTFLLSQFARQHVKVALGGDGGDEILAGYPTLQAHRLIEYYERIFPLFVRAKIIPRLVDTLPVSFDDISFDFKVRRFISGRGVPMEIRHHRWLGSFTDDEKRQLLQPWMILDNLDTYDIARKYVRHCDAHEAINQLLYCDMKLYLEGNMLVKVDRASMASSLEVRVPLLNPILFEFIADLPSNLKLRRLTTKYILKKSMAGILPREVIKRGKKGFNIPIAKWINADLKELVMDIFSPDRIKRQGLFNPQYVQKLLNEHSSGKIDHRKLLWTLLAFQLWYERYVN